MTGDQSRRTKSWRPRFCWQASLTDLGTVVGTTWNGVTIDWDDGHTIAIEHNDMMRIERAPMKLA